MCVKEVLLILFGWIFFELTKGLLNSTSSLQESKPWVLRIVKKAFKFGPYRLIATTLAKPALRQMLSSNGINFLRILSIFKALKNSVYNVWI